MKIKVSEATGPVLDRMVAKCEGFEITWDDVLEDFWLETAIHHGRLGNYNPSTNWSQGGPIAEREQIDIFYDGNTVVARKAHMVKHPTHDMMSYCAMRGHTTLIAGMRCYVASKLGEEVDIPNELAK